MKYLYQLNQAPRYNLRMPAYELAQINIARLVAPMDDPRIAGFVAQLDSVNHLAETSHGFVWRLKSESGSAVDIPYSDDPFIIVNMSVWESLDSLAKFTYSSPHVHVFRNRHSWFEKMALPHYCLWWIAAGRRPTIEKANSAWNTTSKTAQLQQPSGFRSLSPCRRPSLFLHSAR